MTTGTVDDRKRIVLPMAKPGQVFTVELNPDGSVTLREVVVQRAKARLEKSGGLTLAVSERPITQEQVRACLNEFP